MNDSKLQCLALMVHKTVNLRPVTDPDASIFSSGPLGGKTGHADITINDAIEETM